MKRMPIVAGLVFVALSTGRERFEARYSEGSELVHAQTDVTAMEVDEVTLDGEELSLDVLEEMGFPDMRTRDERTLRYRDTVLAVDEGRPTRVRRAFEELRKHSVDGDEERDETGVLEGRSVLANEGRTLAELEDDGDEVEEAYLVDHALIRYADHLLPEEPVEVGERWQLAEDDLRLLIGVESRLAYFESDLEDQDEDFGRVAEENSTVQGEAEFVEVVERDGLSCAVVAFEVELETEVDDLEALGMEDGTEGALQYEVRFQGRLWYSPSEGRPVAMEMEQEGTLDMRMAMPFGEAEAPSLEFRAKGSITGEFASTWGPPE
jgi:hypothetical protein